MTAWATLRRVGTGAALALLLLASPAARGADDPPVLPGFEKPTVVQLRAAAEAAEKAGDWETAFATYCRLYVADRGAPDVREKLGVLFRRVQQVRRHRDPVFQKFVTTLSFADASKLFGEAMTKVPVYYVDRERATPQLLWEHGLDELARALASPAFRRAFLDDVPADRVDGFRGSLRTSWAKQTVANAADAKRQLGKLLDKAEESFPVRSRSALVIEIVFGACSGLDEYSVYLSPAAFNPASGSAVPDLTAQGVELAFADGALVIAGVVPGSWAALHAKELRKGDRVVRLNGRVMDAATPALAAEALRGPVEGFHEIETAAPGSDLLGPPARVPVVVPTVYGTTLLKDGVGYARVGSIGAPTPRELDEALHWLKARGVRAVVLDLRGNIGGSFVAGVDTAKRLIPAGVIVTTQGQRPEVDNRPFTSDSGMAAHDIPLVVLVDSETASSAEVLAAALKDHNRATLVGMPTFGKGSVQYPVRFDSLDEKDPQGQPRTSKSGSVRLTIAKLFSPRGEPINGVGISPHVLEADPDRQLDLAVEKAAGASPPLPRMPGGLNMP